MQGSGRLTTHVLDTMHGKPAAGMRLDLLMMHGDHSHHILTTHTNADGTAEFKLIPVYRMLCHARPATAEQCTLCWHKFTSGYVEVTGNTGRLR